MSVLLIVLAVLCVLVGIAGCILPVLPGPPLSFVALLLMRWSGAAEFDSRFLTIWVGLIVGMVFFPPAGLIIGAFVGAFVGELIHDGSDKLKALRVAVSSFAAFILGTGMKLAVSLAIGFYVIRALFV